MTRYTAIAAQVHVELVDKSKLDPDGVTKKNNPRSLPRRPKELHLRARSEGHVGGVAVPNKPVKRYKQVQQVW
jgi:hypothetical protein